MAKETLNLEVKSNIKSVAKDQKEWNKEIKKTKENIEDVNEEGKEVVAEMQILGLSINGLKAAWTAAASGAKFLFRSIQAGIASTGVGLLLIAFGTLSTWFASTKAGAEILSVAFKGVGAAVKVIIDRIASFGGGLAKLLTGNVKAGLIDMRNSFKGIGEEIVAETLFVMALEKSLQKLTDSQRVLNVETAQRRADIEELKLIAEDVTKSEEERLAAAEKAFGIETDLLDRRIDNAEEAVRIEQLRLSTVLDPSAEQLDVLAQKEIDLANIRGESVTKQIELNNKINAIKQETINKNDELKLQREAELKETQDLLDQLQILRQKDQNAKELLALEGERKVAIANAKLITDTEKRNKRIQLINEIYSEKYLALIDKQYNIEIDGNKNVATDVVEWSKMSAEEQVRIASDTAGQMATIAGEQTEVGKAFAIVQATIDTFASAQAAYKAVVGIIPIGPVLAPIAAAAAVAAGMANINAIRGAGGGGGGGGGISGGGGVAAAPPAPQMMSGAFELTGGQPVEPTRAYVVSDDITNSQNGLEIIRRRATI